MGLQQCREHGPDKVVLTQRLNPELGNLLNRSHGAQKRGRPIKRTGLARSTRLPGTGIILPVSAATGGEAAVLSLGD